MADIVEKIGELYRQNPEAEDRIGRRFTGNLNQYLNEASTISEIDFSKSKKEHHKESLSLAILLAHLPVEDLFREFGTEAILWTLLEYPYDDEQLDQLKSSYYQHTGMDKEIFETAKRTIWQGWCSRDPGDVLGVYELLKQHSDLNIRTDELNDCRSVLEMKQKMGLYEHLSNGDLNKFYNSWKPIFSLGGIYNFVMNTGTYECSGGLELMFIQPGPKVINFVGGKIHKNNLTDIRSIHGGREAEQQIAKFKEQLGIHPANLNLLLYLKLSQHLEHDDITIFGKASGFCNGANKNSALYQIPRNYFRLKVNPETHKYGFNGEKRDRILDKFAAKNHVIKESFDKFDRYLEKREQNLDYAA